MACRPRPASLKISSIQLGRGAYGTVVEGELDGRPVAVKTLLSDIARDKPLEDFIRECQLQATLEDHPNIVKSYGTFESRMGEPMLVLERMKENLREYLGRNRGALSRERQLEICLSIASALKFLHERNPPVAHRDVTDKNILIGEDGSVKVSDLGQSKLLENRDVYMSTTAPGTVMYMPPEALKSGKARFNVKVDVFSFGVLMLQIATQCQPTCDLVGIGVTPETERRRDDLSKLPNEHALKPLIELCLKDDYKNRPDVRIIHDLIQELHKAELLISSMRAVQVTPHEVSKQENNESGNCFRSDLLLSGHRFLKTYLPDMPIPVSIASAHYVDRKVFITGGGLGDGDPYYVIQFYHIDDRKWTIISGIPTFSSRSNIIQGQLTLIGGRDAATGEVTGKLSTYVNDRWEEIYPPIPTPRHHHRVILEENLLITAGGQLEDVAVNIVEVLNIESREWYRLKCLQLPEPLYCFNFTISSGYVYIGGGWNAAKRITNGYWRLPWSAVQQSIQNRDNVSSAVIWEEVAEPPFRASSLLPNSKLPIVFGGWDTGKRRSDIFVYCPTQKRWTAVGNMSTECDRPCVVPINSNVVFACGGFMGNKSCTGKTELLVMCP